MRSVVNFLINKFLPCSKQDYNAIPREQWIAQSLLRIPAGSRLLDAGAGELANKKYCDHLRYVSQDFCEYTGAGDGVGLQTGMWQQVNLDIISDIVAVPEVDESFDAIMCTEVFEHIPDPLKALKEFKRLLKPGGYLLLTAPFCSFAHMTPYFYGTGFSSYWYKHHFESFGFEIIELAANGNFSSYLAQEVSRIPFVANAYTNVKLSCIESISMQIILRLLARMYKQDANSKDLVCFGYHVLAQKI